MENYRVLFLISNYQRFEMLTKLIIDINSIDIEGVSVDYMVFDDCSSYTIGKNVIRFKEHRGKERYWETFNDMFQYAKMHEYDLYVFTPNDFLNYDFQSLFRRAVDMSKTKYVFNIINDGRTCSWTGRNMIRLNKDTYRSFFTDCGFFTNRTTLNALDFKVMPIKEKPLFEQSKSGSGVGKQLSSRLCALNIPIFTPVKSLAYHGEHESLMNPEIRKHCKLVSL